MIKVKQYELEQELIKSGLQQYKFAVKMGMAPSNFSAVFSGARQPTIAFIDKVCLGTGRNFNDLFEIVEK